MNWKTTLTTIFLPLQNVKKSRRTGRLLEDQKWKSKNLVLAGSLFLASGVCLSAQSSDSCIAFENCPEDFSICANTPNAEGVRGAYVTWEDPDVIQSCINNGETGNFQMHFELDESLLTQECWDFNYVSRTEQNGGQISLFSDLNDEMIGNTASITTPYLILPDNSTTSIEINFSPPQEGEEYTYTVQLFLVDQDGNEISSGNPIQVNSLRKEYNFLTNNLNNEIGIYRLKYVFVYSGAKPSDANTVDTIISEDGMLYNEECASGVDFTVFAPKKGFYPIGTHPLEYVARYQTDAGIMEERCTFNLTVTGLDLQISDIQEADCNGTGGSFIATASGIGGTEATSIQYSIDGINFYSSGAFDDLEPGSYTVTARDENNCQIQETVTITKSPPPAAPEMQVVISPYCGEITGAFAICCDNGMEYTLDGITFQKEPFFADLAPGTYEVFARNVSGCLSEGTIVTIEEQPSTPAKPVISSTTQPTCTVPTGSVTVEPVNGLEYSIDGASYAPVVAFDGLVPGDYQITARNAEGCVSEPALATISPLEEAPKAPIVQELFQPGCADPSGMIVLEVIEGIRYHLSGGGIEERLDEGAMFTDLAPGMYTIFAENAEGCISGSISVTIEPQPQTPQAPVVSAVEQPNCESSTGSFSITTEPGLVYSIDGENFQTEGTFSGLSSDIVYEVIARNTEGCISEPSLISFDSEDSAPVAPELSSRSLNLCIGDRPYEFKQLFPEEFDESSGIWEDPARTGALVNGTINPALLEVGTYTFNYVQTNGTCSTTTSMEININDDCIVLACGIEDVKDSISKTVTPNGDGINDSFVIGLNAECGFTYHLQLFNRWGNKVFESNPYQNNWSGENNNAISGSDQLPSGTYYYIITIEQSGLEPIQGYIYLGTN